jgi:hypothetical protein
LEIGKMVDRVSIESLWNDPASRALAQEARDILASEGSSPEPPPPVREVSKEIDHTIEQFSPREEILPEFET